MGTKFVDAVGLNTGLHDASNPFSQSLTSLPLTPSNSDILRPSVAELLVSMTTCLALDLPEKITTYRNYVSLVEHISRLEAYPSQTGYPYASARVAQYMSGVEQKVLLGL